MKNLSSLGVSVKEQARAFRVKGAGTIARALSANLHFQTRCGVPLHEIVHDVIADRSLERWPDEVVGRLTERATAAGCIAAGYSRENHGFEVSDVKQVYPYKIHTIALDLVAAKFGKAAVMREHINGEAWAVRGILNQPDVIAFYRECFTDIAMSLLALTDDEIAAAETALAPIIAKKKAERAARKNAKVKTEA